MEEQDPPQNVVQQQAPGSSNFVHLIVFEKGVKSFYYSKCKVEISKRTITVTPDDEVAPKIKRKIENNFVKHNKIICFFSSSNGFALIFDHSKDSNWAYGVLEKRRGRGGGNPLSETAFERRFLIPMIKELEDFEKLQYEFRVFILKLLKYLDVEQKQRLAPAIIATKLDNDLLKRVLKGVDLTATKPGPSKKPKLNDQDESLEVKTDEKRRSAKKPNSNNNPKLVEQDELFPSNDISSNTNQQSQCSSSKLPKRVTFAEDEESSSIHIKKPRLSNNISSNNHTSTNSNKVPIRFPFETIDYTQCGITKTHLFIFTDDSKTTCFEYNWDCSVKQFRCCQGKCRKRGPVITKDSNGIEKVYFAHPQCSCSARHFDRELYKDDIHVFKSQYNIVDELSQGKIKSKLYVYTSEDKKKAYKFDYDEKGKRYLCIKCRINSHYVRAVTCINGEGEEFVAIRDKPHKCKPIDC